MTSHGKTDNNFMSISTPGNYSQLESMQRLKDSILELARFTLPHSLSKEASEQIEARFHEVLTEIHHNRIPDHPPYSEMIFKAIDALREEGSSCQESISSYIRAKYHKLPWAHESFLSHHLAQLVMNGEITITPNGFYLLPTSIPKLNENQKEVQKEPKIPSTVLQSTGANIVTHSVKPVKVVIEERPSILPAQTQIPQMKDVKWRGRPPKVKRSEENVNEKCSQSKSKVIVEVKKDHAVKEQEKVKKRRGRPPKKQKIEAKEKEKDKEDIEKQSRKKGKFCSKLRGDQEEVVLKEKMVFYGPKRRRGRPPKAKP